MHQKPHNKLQTLPITISIRHATGAVFVENVGLSLQLLKPSHKLQSLPRSRTGRVVAHAKTIIMMIT